MAQEVHSAFGGSVISRRINCAGSYALEASVPKPPSSRYAAEGTVAHEFAAWLLDNGKTQAANYVGAKISPAIDADKFPITLEMAQAVHVYIDAVWAEHRKSDGAQLYIEQSFDLDVPSAEPGEVHGCNDAMIYHPSLGRLVVFDYKHGAGVSVSAEDNDQLKFYATGAAFANDWTIRELELVIVQPRARDNETPADAVRRWPMEVVDLLEFQQEVEGAVKRSKAPTTSYQVGPWCRWCDAASICPAKQAEALEPFGDVDIEALSAADLPDPTTLVPERLSRIVAGLSTLQAWGNQCQEYLEALLLGGTSVPGWKVVDKIGRAKWVSDEETVAQTLAMLYDIDEELVRPRKLVTIGDAEKLLKGAGATKDEIDSFKLANTLKESSGKTIAPESDRRPAVNVVEQAFSDVDLASIGT